MEKIKSNVEQLQEGLICVCGLFPFEHGWTPCHEDGTSRECLFDYADAPFYCIHCGRIYDDQHKVIGIR